MADPHLQRLIQLEAMELDLDPALALALAQQESGLNPRATSPTGVQGVFQVTKQTGRAYGQDPNARTNPVESTEAGLRYFKDLLTQKGGDVPAALMAYNGGSDPAFDRNVLRHYEQFAGVAHPALTQPRQGTPRQQPPQDRSAIEERIRALEALEGGTSVPTSTVAPVSPPADFTIDIGGEPAPAPADLRGGVPREEIYQRIDAGLAEAKAKQESGTALIPGIALEAGGSIAGAIGGAKLGGMLGPAGALVGGITGAIVGGGAGNRAGKAVGVIAPEEPWVETPVANVYTSDLLGAAGTLLPGVVRAGKAAVKYGTRAGRALTKAEQATAQQAQEALETYQRQMGEWQASEALKREAWDTDRADEVLRTNRANAETLRQWQTKEGQRVLTDAEQVALTQAAYEDAAGAMEQAFSTQSTANYRVAAAKAKQLQQDHRAALKQFDEGKAQHAAAVKRLQDLPQRYEPHIPPPVARTATDVQRDMAVLDRGGAEADAVLQRLGTDDLFDASIKLNEEEHAFRQRPPASGTGEGPSAAGPFHDLATGQTQVAARFPNLPAYVQEEIASRVWQAQSLGLIADIERFAAEGLTARQLAERLRSQQRLGTLTGQDARAMVLGVRSFLGIPSQEAASEFAAWQRAYVSRSAPPSGPIPSPYQQAARQATPAAETDPLLAFLREGDAQGQKGIRLSEDDLREGWGAIISNRETGTSGLLNNRSGRSVQDAANDAFELGLIDSPETDALRAGIDDALRGRGSQGRLGRTPDAPGFAPDVPPPSTPAPPRRGPQRASAVWYQRLDDMAGTAPVDLTPAHEAAATVQQQLMDMLPSLQDPLARKVVKDLTEASTEGNVAQVHAALKALGRSVRSSSNPEHRYLLGQMAEGFQSALEYSAKLYPETSKGLELMQQAKRAWRQEHAVDELHSLFRTSGPIVTQTKSGELKMDVGKLLNRVENLIKGESPSKGSFTSRGALPLKDLMDLRAQLKTFVGTPDLPTQRPPPPGPVQVETPSRLGPPQVPRVTPPPPRTAPPTLETPTPVEPELGAFGGGATLTAATTAAALGVPGLAVTIASVKTANYWLSALLLSPRFRPLVLKAIQPNGTIDPQTLGVLAAAAREVGEMVLAPSDTEEEAPPRRK